MTSSNDVTGNKLEPSANLRLSESNNRTTNSTSKTLTFHTISLQKSRDEHLQFIVRMREPDFIQLQTS